MSSVSRNSSRASASWSARRGTTRRAPSTRPLTDLDRLSLRLSFLRAFLQTVLPRVEAARAEGLVVPVEAETVVVADKAGAGVEGVVYVVASGRGAEHLASDDRERFWESKYVMDVHDGWGGTVVFVVSSHALSQFRKKKQKKHSGTRRVTLRIPYGQLWSELRLKAEEYGNYSPEVLSLAVYVPHGPPGAGGRKKVLERAQVPVVRSGWVTLLEVKQVLAAMAPSGSDSGSGSGDGGGGGGGGAKPLAPEELIRPPLGLGAAQGFAVEVEVTVARNHDHGINCKINCLRVVLGTVATRPGQRDRRVFSFKGIRDSFCVPETGHYRLETKGASAASGRHKRGGRGAVVQGVFHLNKGDKLSIVVGGQGRRRESDSGGGGGTFVWLHSRAAPRVVVPVLVAGGGGGTRGLRDDFDGQDASLTPVAGRGRGTGDSFGEGGRFGGDGKRAGSFGSGGLGVWSAVFACVSETPGSRGGYGGGGTTGSPGGGGGGGYSGGGGGRGGGGGGSYVAPGARDEKLRVGHVGDGEVAVTFVRPRPDLTFLAPADRLRLTLLRRALRAAVESLALLRAQLQQQQQQQPAAVAKASKRDMADVGAFYALVQDLFPSTVFPRQLRPLHEWLLELTVRG